MNVGPCDYCGALTASLFLTMGDMGRGSFYRCGDCCAAVSAQLRAEEAFADAVEEWMRKDKQ